MALVGMCFVIVVVELILRDNLRKDSQQESQLNTSATVVVVDKVEAHLSHLVVFAMVNNAITRQIKTAEVIADFPSEVANQASFSS